MGTVVERIPYDIWDNVAQFLPRELVPTLYNVNRSLLQIARLARWKVLKLAKCDKHTKWMLEIIRHVLLALLASLSPKNNTDDGHGNLVREVTIQPWLVQPSLKPSYKRGGSLWSFIRGLFDSQYAERELNRRVQKRLEKDIRRVTNAISGMHNLTKYSLEWDDSRKFHIEMYRAFLKPVLGSEKFESNLLSLSLNVPIDMLATLASISLRKLENLEVYLCTQKKKREEIDYIFDSFAIFVNNLFPTLETISVSSRLPSKSLILDRLFSNLGTFPRLRKFGLSIPGDGTHLSSPDAVVTFLNKHRQTLKALRFCASRSTLVSPLNFQSKYWISAILMTLDNPYPYLHDLHIALRPLEWDLKPLLEFISIHSLDTLKLTDRPLSNNQVVHVLDALDAGRDHPIKKVHLKLQHLDPDFLELFATRLRKLRVLELVFSDIGATARYQLRDGPHAHSTRAHLRLFEAEFRSNPSPYTSWELGTLGLLHDTAYPNVRELFKVFADCIPAVQHHIDMTLEPRRGS